MAIAGRSITLFCLSTDNEKEGFSTIKDSYLDTLKQAGVNWLGLGIESANQQVRQEVTKGKFQEINIRDIVSKISDHGINSGGNFIFGLPKDNYDSMNETLNLALDLQQTFLQHIVLVQSLDISVAL